jgi:hypothetical protein
MKNQLYFFLFGLLLFASACISNKGMLEESYVEIFTGDGAAWSIQGTGNWTIDEEVITGMDGVGFLTTEDEFSDFILTAEFFPDESINSGIFIRCAEEEITLESCYEINIWDDHTNQDYRTGAIVTHGKPKAIVHTIGKWNTYRIKAKGDRIQVWVNQIKTADKRLAVSNKGYIALQVNGEGVIKFRNVRVRPL